MTRAEQVVLDEVQLKLDRIERSVHDLKRERDEALMRAMESENERDERRFERDQLQRTIDGMVTEEQETRENQLKIRELVVRERDAAQALCRELAQASAAATQYTGPHTCSEVSAGRRRVHKLLVAHPELLK